MLTALPLLLFALTAVALAQVRREFARERTLAATSGVLVWFIYLGLTALVSYYAWRSLWALPITQPLLTVVGTLLSLLGALLFGLAVYQFRSLSRMSGQREDDLITGGVYRTSRNPQNVGWLLFLLGVSLLGGSAAGVALTLAFWLILHIYLVTVEEPHLREVFGERYRRYISATPRYLGYSNWKENLHG